MSEWEDAAGPICPKCGNETQRMVNGQCIICYKTMVAKKEEEQEERSMRRYYTRALQKGTVSLQQMRENRL